MTATPSWRGRSIAGRLTLAAAAGLILQPTAAPARAATAPHVAEATPLADTNPLKIMPLGDSITYGRWSETTSSYRIDLQTRLRSAGMNVDFVGSQKSGSPATADLDNEGHPGWRIDQLAAQVDGWLATYQPDVVLLLAGTNDMNQNYQTETAPDRLASLIDQIHTDRPAAQVFVQLLPSSKTPATADRITTFNATIAAIVASRSSFAHAVDQSGISGVLLSDPLHPNDYGFARMSYNLYRAMEAVYNTSGTPWPAGVNPYRVTHARMCSVAITVDAARKWHYAWDCATWFLRPLATIVNGEQTVTKVWQRQRKVTTSYKVWVRPYSKTILKNHKKVKVHVKGHYVTAHRIVTKWVTA